MNLFICVFKGLGQKLRIAVFWNNSSVIAPINFKMKVEFRISKKKEFNVAKLMHDSFPFHVTPIHCEDSPIYYNGHDHVFKLLRDPLSKMRDKSNRTLISESRFIRNNEVICTKWFHPSCHHCIGNLIKSDQFHTFLKQSSIQSSIFHRSYRRSVSCH